MYGLGKIFSYIYDYFIGSTAVNTVFKSMNPGVVEFFTYVGYISVVAWFVFAFYLAIYIVGSIIKGGIVVAQTVLWNILKVGAVVGLIFVAGWAMLNYMPPVPMDEMSMAM